MALALTVATTVLTGCASAEGESSGPLAEPTEALKSEAPAFHFESGTLELGDFDPDTLGDDLFDPCTEISEAEFAAAGMTGVEPEPALSSGLVQGCRTDQPEPAVTRTVIGSRTTAYDAATASGYETDFTGSDVAGMYTFKNPLADPFMCIAQVDTVRGGLAIGIALSGAKKNSIDPCERASEELSRLLKSAAAET